MTDAFTTNLRAMSLLALLVGMFLIYGAVSFAVLQRRSIMACCGRWARRAPRCWA